MWALYGTFKSLQAFFFFWQMGVRGKEQDKHKIQDRCSGLQNLAFCDLYFIIIYRKHYMSLGSSESSYFTLNRCSYSYLKDESIKRHAKWQDGTHAHEEDIPWI